MKADEKTEDKNVKGEKQALDKTKSKNQAVVEDKMVVDKSAPPESLPLRSDLDPLKMARLIISQTILANTRRRALSKSLFRTLKETIRRRTGSRYMGRREEKKVK